MSPMHLEVHTLGLSTGLRRVLYRQEKKPKAALRQPERSIRQGHSHEWQSQNLAGQGFGIQQEIEMDTSQPDCKAAYEAWAKKEMPWVLETP